MTPNNGEIIYNMYVQPTALDLTFPTDANEEEEDAESYESDFSIELKDNLGDRIVVQDEGEVVVVYFYHEEKEEAAAVMEFDSNGAEKFARAIRLVSEYL